MQNRRRSLSHSFVDHLAVEKARPKARLANARGRERDVPVEKIRQIETAARINSWLSSPGL
jgi:hypothetical protein